MYQLASQAMNSAEKVDKIIIFHVTVFTDKMLKTLAISDGTQATLTD